MDIACTKEASSSQFTEKSEEQERSIVLINSMSAPSSDGDESHDSSRQEKEARQRTDKAKRQKLIEDACNTQAADDESSVDVSVAVSPTQTKKKKAIKRKSPLQFTKMIQIDSTVEPFVPSTPDEGRLTLTTQSPAGTPPMRQPSYPTQDYPTQDSSVLEQTQNSLAETATIIASPFSTQHSTIDQLPAINAAELANAMQLANTSNPRQLSVRSPAIQEDGGNEEGKCLLNQFFFIATLSNTIAQLVLSRNHKESSHDGRGKESLASGTYCFPL